VRACKMLDANFIGQAGDGDPRKRLLVDNIYMLAKNPSAQMLWILERTMCANQRIAWGRRYGKPKGISVPNRSRPRTSSDRAPPL